MPAKKRQPASSHFSKSAMPPYLLMHFLVCVGWMWFVLQYYYIHTHCCRKVIFVIFIIYTISCRKTIIRTKSIRLKKCCETLLTGDKIDLLCWFMKKNFSVENGYFHHRHHVLSGTTLMYSSYVSGWTTGRHHAGQPGAKSYQLWWPREAGFCSYIVVGHRHFFFFQRWTRICKKKSQVTELRDTLSYWTSSKVKGPNGFLANQQFLICDFFVLFVRHKLIQRFFMLN